MLVSLLLFPNVFSGKAGGLAVIFKPSFQCPWSDPLVIDLVSLLGFFILTQLLSGPTRELGHTLELVLSYGPMSPSQIRDTRISGQFLLVYLQQQSRALIIKDPL